MLFLEGKMKKIFIVSFLSIFIITSITEEAHSGSLFQLIKNVGNVVKKGGKVVLKGALQEGGADLYRYGKGLGTSSLSKESENTEVINKYIESPSSYNENEALKALGNAMLEDWRNAWSEKNFSWYSSFYSKNFYGVTRSGNEDLHKNYQEWLSYKKTLFSRYKSITVETKLNDIEIINESTIKIYFSQWFDGKANNPKYSYSDFNKKIIYAKLENGRFYIIEERPY